MKNNQESNAQTDEKIKTDEEAEEFIDDSFEEGRNRTIIKALYRIHRGTNITPESALARALGLVLNTAAEKLQN